MTSLKTGILVAAAGVLALSAGFATYNLLGGPDLISGALLLSDDADVGSLMAAKFPDVNGVPTSIADAKEKILVVNFWATWCTPCREEIPDFVRLQGEYRGKGVRFFGIAAERPEKIPAFAAEFKINYPLLVGDFAAIEIAKKLGDTTGALPFTIVLDGQRKIVHRELGVLSASKLTKIFVELL